MKWGRAAAAIAAAVTLLVVLVAAGGQARAPGVHTAAKGIQTGSGPYNAVVRRTTHGIPHVLAADWGSLGFGYGYAFAEDNICTIAESYLTVAAQRSRYFGPDAGWNFRGNGSVVNNLNSDFFYQRINDSGIVDRLANQPAPLGPKPEIKEGVKGYVAGYNRYLDKTGVNNISDPRCRGADWVHKIDERDVYRRFYQLASLASQGVAIDGIGGAQPLTGSSSQQQSALERLKSGDASLRLPIGSNAYGLGRDMTSNGRGMVLGNPHFPWDGPERLYQSHLTIPGKLDVTGGSLYGVPLILIGHTQNLAWSHTVATAFRFTPFELTLAPGDPTSYVIDGQLKKMDAAKVTVKVKTANGLEDRSRTLYRTEFGPMITSILGLPLFPWTNTKAYAMGDVNENNFRYLNHFFDNNLAQSVRQYDAVERKYQGIPWVNSIGADSKGEAYYSMEGAIPNVPDSKISACPTALGQASVPIIGLPTLDGSRSACKWDNDPDAAVPGIFGPSHVPRLFRNDFVHNGNDSHWLTNPRQPLTGYAKIIGNEGTARSLRTRLGLKQLLDHKGKFDLDELQRVALSDRQYAGELWRDELVSMCKSNPTLQGSSGPVDVSAACPVLAAWNLHDDLDSKGAILFRRFASRALANPGGLPVGVPGTSGPFSRPFDPADPVNTPSGLNTDSPQVKQALADAVTDLRSSHIPLDAPLRGYQYDDRGGERIPIHGGPGTLGVFNAINVLWKPGVGYPDVPHGSSFIMAMQFTAHGPESRSFVTYGESENPKSPYANDQTKLFSQKRWSDMEFTPEKIVRDRALKLTQIGCVTTPGFRSARVRAAGRGLGFRFRPQLKLPVSATVYRVSRGRKAPRPVRVARFSRKRSFRWKPRHRLRSGWYIARL